jgi:transposase
MSREEKAQYVIQLYKENKSIREIAKLMHMSFRDIGAIINRLKSEAERERGFTNNEEEMDTEPKSKESQAFKMFSEGKDPVDVVIALNIPADEVRAIYRDYWGLNDMHKLVEVYEEIRPYLPSFLRLHKILNDLGMREQEIINVLNLANSHQLKHLQWKTEYLRNDIEMLEAQKTILNRIIDEFQQTLNNSCKFSQPDASWYSVDISYTPMNNYWPQQ